MSTIPPTPSLYVQQTSCIKQKLHEFQPGLLLPVQRWPTGPAPLNSRVHISNYGGLFKCHIGCVLTPSTELCKQSCCCHFFDTVKNSFNTLLYSLGFCGNSSLLCAHYDKSCLLCTYYAGVNSREVVITRKSTTTVLNVTDQNPV